MYLIHASFPLRAYNRLWVVIPNSTCKEDGLLNQKKIMNLICEFQTTSDASPSRGISKCVCRIIEITLDKTLKNKIRI